MTKTLNDLTPAEQDELEIPFDWHTSADGSAEVVTTEPESAVDRNQCQSIAVVPAGVDTANGSGLLSTEEVARFISDALNEYVNTQEGLARWREIFRASAPRRPHMGGVLRCGKCSLKSVSN